MEKSQAISTMTGGEGNTLVPPEKPKRYRRYCFTLNNYTEEELSHIKSQLEDYDYIIGREVGKEGTPHLQGFIDFKVQKVFHIVKNLISDRAHIEACKGSRDQNIKYCKKDNNFITNIPGVKKIRIPKDPLMGKTPTEFQREVLNIIKDEPDDRTIHWFWEPKGNTGKTSLCKHIVIHHKEEVCILNGKQSDMYNGIIKFKEIFGDYPTIIIIDIPRSSLDYVSWSAIEKIKDGLFFSGKYEGGWCIMDSPHVICMANSPPPKDKFSKDRWNIREI